MQLAQLMLKTEFDRQSAQRDERKQAESALAQAQQQQLSEMQESADKREAAGKEQAVGQIVGGAIEVGSAGASLAQAEGVKMGPVSSTLASPTAAQGGQGLANGICSFDAAGKTREASDADIRSKADENRAAVEKSRVDDARDDKRAADESVGRVLDWLKSMEDTSAQTTQAAIGRA
jgi:hypothetical protein